MSLALPCVQVGSDLELVSKDERELEASRAELEALILQQRSAQASNVDSPPSTSFPSPPAAQHSEWHPRGHRSIHAPKQASRHNPPPHTPAGQVLCGQPIPVNCLTILTSTPAKIFSVGGVACLQCACCWNFTLRPRQHMPKANEVHRFPIPNA